MLVSFRIIAFLGVAVVLSSLSCRSGGNVAFVDGPEDETVAQSLSGLLVMDRPVGGIAAVNMASRSEHTIRSPNQGKLPVHSLSGPAQDGTIAFVVDDMMRLRHQLRVLSGRRERLVFEAAGSALWDDSIGRHLALNRRGTRVAVVRWLRPVQLKGALFEEGQVEIWDLADSSESARTITTATALDDPVHWTEDGDGIIYSRLVDWNSVQGLRQLSTEFAKAYPGVPDRDVFATFRLSLATGESEPVALGRTVCYSNGRYIVKGHGGKGFFALLDGDGQTYQPVKLPRVASVISFVGPQEVLYVGSPTAGVQLRKTTNHSPLVGRSRQMLSVKVGNVVTGGFRTLLPHVDRRLRFAVGHGDVGENSAQSKEPHPGGMRERKKPKSNQDTPPDKKPGKTPARGS